MDGWAFPAPPMTGGCFAPRLAWAQPCGAARNEEDGKTVLFYGNLPPEGRAEV